MTTAHNVVAFDPAVPLQHQIYLQLRHEIADGLWLDRGDFPGEKELATLYGVSVITSRAALDRLAAEGWVQRQRGRGTRAIHQPIPTPAGDGPALLPVEFPRGKRLPYRYDVLDASVRIAPVDACAAFSEPPGTELWQCKRLRRYRGKPHSVTHNAQRPEVGLRHRPADLRSKPMAEILSGQGIELRRMRRRMHATSAPPFVAERLDLTIVDPVLLVTFTMHDDDDRPVEWVRIYLHPNQPAPQETMDLTSGTWSASTAL